MSYPPYQIGQRVRAARDITQPADEDLPAQMFATKGTELIVRESPGNWWFCFVANPKFKPDVSFGVRADEIEAI